MAAEDVAEGGQERGEVAERSGSSESEEEGAKEATAGASGGESVRRNVQSSARRWEAAAGATTACRARERSARRRVEDGTGSPAKEARGTAETFSDGGRATKWTLEEEGCRRA